MRVCLPLVISLSSWLGLSAVGFAQNFPVVEAVLNADKSAVVVTGQNTTGQNYRCGVEARIRVTGQRAFARLQCTFPLPANTAQRQVCQQDGTGPRSLDAVEGVKMTCVPN